MPTWILIALLAVFVAHLVAFALLGLRRRQGYYLALVVTFSLLSAGTGVQLAGLEGRVAGMGLDQALRYAAWAAAAVSVGWTLVRILQRRRQARLD